MTEIEQRAKRVFDKLHPGQLIKGLEEIERLSWEHLCDVFERLTGESLDDADSKKNYREYGSLVRIWAEHLAEWKRSDPDELQPKISQPHSQTDLRRIERRAWKAADEFLDQIAHACWSEDEEPETKKYLAVTEAVDAWGIAMSEVRIQQGYDGVRWGANVLRFETAKVRRFRRERPPR